MRRFDSDGDGNITLEEFRGPRDRFEAVDRDQDGVISAAELDAHFSRGVPAAPARVANVTPISYPSSVDGAPCTGTIWIPESEDRSPRDLPLVVFLGGGPGVGTIPEKVLVQCQERGWVAMGLAGRSWPQGTVGDCTYPCSMAYLDHPDPAIGPGRQDILDGVDWAVAEYGIDPSRVYLCGFSLGGRGTYMIGLASPDRFAAIAPFAPATDMFELDICTSTTRASYPCRMAIAGGVVGASPKSATLRSMQSARFLIENAYNLPIFHGHGTEDGLANNVRSDAAYNHGYNLTIDSSWHGAYEFQGRRLDFGHTPTLAELHARHPQGYPFAYMFTRIGHAVDTRWLTGVPREEGDGVPDPDDPDRLLGAFDFFARQRLVESPDTVVYKSYTDVPETAYWLTLEIQRPWENVPGAVRASRDVEANRLSLESARLKHVAIDLDRAGLRIGPEQPLVLDVAVLDEPVYDPALRARETDSRELRVSLKAISLEQGDAGTLALSGSGGTLQVADGVAQVRLVLDPSRARQFRLGSR